MDNIYKEVDELYKKLNIPIRDRIDLNEINTSLQDKQDDIDYDLIYANDINKSFISSYAY